MWGCRSQIKPEKHSFSANAMLVHLSLEEENKTVRHPQDRFYSKCKHKQQGKQSIISLQDLLQCDHQRTGAYEDGEKTGADLQHPSTIGAGSARVRKQTTEV
jgi:hypothetical protein